MKCSNCGTEFNEGIFCPECGTRYETENREIKSAGVNKQQVLQEKPQKEKYLPVKIGLICLIIAIAVFGFMCYVWQGSDSVDLEQYMTEEKQSWTKLGFQGEDDYEVYRSEGGTTIIFDDGKPYILTMDKADTYNYHGVEIGGTNSEVKEAMQDSYDVIIQDEAEIVYKDKNKNIWVGFVFVDGKVNTIVATTDESLFDVEKLPEDIEDNTEDTTEPDNTTTETTIADIPATPSEFNGLWYDTLTERCHMEIISVNDAYFDILIDWGSSATENSHWEFSGEYDADKGGIVYKDGIYCEEHYPENGGDVERNEIYHNGEGLIYFQGDALYWEEWVPSNGENGFVFQRVEEGGSTSDDYILPDSSSIRLTESDISHLSLRELNYAKNEIYARHGRIFQSQELRDYFESKSWYNGFIEAADFDEEALSPIERDNIRLLQEAEFRMDPNGYPLD